MESSNRIHFVLADELSIHVCALFNQSLQHGTLYLIVLKKLMFAQYLKVVIRQFLLITDDFHFWVT